MLSCKHAHPLRTQAKHNVWEHCLTLLLLFFFFTSISYACLVVLLLVFRVCEVQREAEVMAVCLVLGWCNVMFFARGFEMLGPYVITIQKVRMCFTRAPWVTKTWVCSAHTPAHTCFHLLFWFLRFYIFRLSSLVSHFPLDYIWRPDKVYVADFHCALCLFHLWVYCWQ